MVGLRKQTGPDEVLTPCPEFFLIFAFYRIIVNFYDLKILCMCAPLSDPGSVCGMTVSYQDLRKHKFWVKICA